MFKVKTNFRRENRLIFERRRLISMTLFFRYVLETK